MVDGINGPKPATQHSTIKIKGSKKTIDLNNLVGLQKTQGNESLFKMYDKDGNGVIDQKEAYAMRNNLQQLAGNGTISAREINKQFGKDTNALEQLTKLADQQAAIGKEYKETNGNTTTTIYRSNVDSKYNYQYTTTKNDNGTTTTVYDDGTREKLYGTGRKHTIAPDGTVTLFDDKGNKETLVQNGEITKFSPDGNKSVTQNAKGQIVRSVELRGNQEVYTKYEHSDGKTIAREYSASGDNAPLTGIVVSGREKNSNGSTNTIETKYGSEEDMKNNRPTSELRNKGLPTETKTEYEYDSKGNKKVKETGLDNITVIKYTDSQGNPIRPGQFDAQETRTVNKGDSITRIVTEELAKQGITNPTADQLKDAKEQFMEMNKDTVKTFGGKYKGAKGFYPGDKVNIPNFKESISARYSDEIISTGKKYSPEMIAKRRELQAKLGDNYDVGYAKDGTIEVRDKKGNILTKATEMANDSSSNEDDINTMMSADKDGNGLDKTEYQTFIMGMLQEAGIEITDSNKAQITKLIDNSFTSMDNLQKDNLLSKDELTKNAPTIIEKLTEQIGNIE